MTGAILDLLLGPLGIAASAIIGVVVAFMTGRSKGKKDEQNKAMRQTQERVEKGRDAVRDGRASGDSPAERLRGNDGQW